MFNFILELFGLNTLSVKRFSQFRILNYPEIKTTGIVHKHKRRLQRIIRNPQLLEHTLDSSVFSKFCNSSYEDFKSPHFLSSSRHLSNTSCKAFFSSRHSTSFFVWAVSFFKKTSFSSSAACKPYHFEILSLNENFVFKVIFTIENYNERIQKAFKQFLP